MQNTINDLALAYSIISYLKLDDHTYTHLSARASDGKSFYINPFGLRFEHVTADNMLHVSMDGVVLKGNEYQYNSTGYVIHGSIYRARQDINAIFHLHTPYTVAVSAMADGLLPISQWALHFYNRVSYHDYNSLVLTFENHQDALTHDLGHNMVMILRNHGIITCGRTIYEAMFYTYHLEMACKAQCLALSMGQKLVMPDQSVCEKSVNDLLNFEEDLGKRDWLAWQKLINISNTN